MLHPLDQGKNAFTDRLTNTEHNRGMTLSDRSWDLIPEIGEIDAGKSIQEKGEGNKCLLKTTQIDVSVKDMFENIYFYLLWSY